MASFKSGMGFEDRLKAFLDKMQYDVEQDEVLDHEYKIDFGIRKFPGNPKHYSLGIQVTQKCDDLEKLKAFELVHNSGFRVVDRVLYVEVENIDVERGVGHLLSTAISSFQFDERFADKKNIGVRICSSMTYSFFDIKERIRSLTVSPAHSIAQQEVPAAIPIVERAIASQPPASILKVEPVVLGKVDDLKSIADALQGKLSKVVPESPKRADEKLIGFINGFYRDRGEGFITGQNGDSFYFRLASVSDGILRDKMLALPSFEWQVPIEGTVSFINVGKTKPNAKYPEARNIGLVSIT